MQIISMVDEILIDSVEIWFIFKYPRVYVTNSLLTDHQVVVE
jgi:hypothetical protein